MLHSVLHQDTSWHMPVQLQLHQSSPNEVRTGAGFQIAEQSWSNQKVTNCSSQNINPSFTANLVAIQRDNSSQQIQYNRTLSIHNYVVVTFLLITTNWTNASSLNFSFYDQAGNKIANDLLQNYLPNVPKQSLCNPTPVDQRFAIVFKMQDTSSTSISISMNSRNGEFSIATWAVLSGLCDATCSSCSFSTDPTACLSCNYFLKQVADGSCSQCPTGFKLVQGSYSFCQKCPIQYQSCSAGLETCFYPQINATTDKNCSVEGPNSFYAEVQEINEQIFTGSLFSVGGLPSPSLYVPCGSQPLSSYTYVGEAQAFQPITRIFASLRAHIAFSISFNVFVVDMQSASQVIKFQVYINENLYEVHYMSMVGMSNLCGGEQLESFMTFPPSKFYPTSQTQNVNLTIVGNIQWGLRNLRLVFQICDDSCLQCGADSCLQCKGLLQLSDGKCQNCPLGFGRNVSATDQQNLCVVCPENCLSCTIGNNTTTCFLCSAAFFPFEGSCQKRANIGETAPGEILSAAANKTCAINISNSNPKALPAPFTLSKDVIATTVIIGERHYKKIVEFQLMRVGLWSPQDKLQVYLNDLLMLSKNYSSYGNRICTNNPNSTQTDFLSFESIDFTDSNSTLSISFELVTSQPGNRTFGVSSLKVYPMGCQNCKSYPFSYSIQYSYDRSLRVLLSFSRTYKSSNPTLFKQIFTLRLNGKNLPYEVVANNSVSYTLQAEPPQDTVDGNLTLLCLYPELVTTDIDDPINSHPFFARLLAANYDTSKVVDNAFSNTSLTRFTPVDNPEAVSGVRTFFQIVSRVVIYVGFGFFLLGLQTVCTHFMHNLQKIWLHIFLASLTAPALLRYALSGFSEVQNQNIAVNPTSWEQGLPLELYYSSPVYLYAYTTDVNFFRNIYNIGVAFLVFVVFLLIMHFLTKKCITAQMSSNLFWRHLKVTFHRRPFFYFNSVVFYQYLTLMLACFLQFTSLQNKTAQGSFGSVSATAAVVVFALGTAYPIFHFLWLRYKQQNIGHNKSIEFANRYHQIFFRFVRREIWEGGEISYSERLYSVYRFGQLWWFGLVATALTYNPQAQLFLMIITFSLHMLLLLFTGISRNSFFKAVKSLELALFVGLEIIMLVCQTDNATLTTRSYNTLGNVAIALVFGIIFCSLIRSIYTAWLIYREYTYESLPQPQKLHARQAQYMRNDMFFNSENGDQNVEIQIVGTDRQ